MKNWEEMINTVVQGDCLEFMKQLPDKCIDLVLTDPPYGIDYEPWDKFDVQWLQEANRVLKDSGSLWVFCGWSNVDLLRKALKGWFWEKNWIIWDRIKGRGAKYNFISTREDIVWLTKDYENYTFNKQSSTIKKKTGGMGQKNGDKFRKLSNVWTDISPIVPWSKERVEHPTQKPVKLMKRIIEISSNPDDIILDPFLGSGTTAVAAKQLNRKFIGIEISEKYCKIANDRLKQDILI